MFLMSEIMKEKYLEAARKFAGYSPCLKVKYGCIIVKKDKVISFGFNEPLHYKDYCKTCSRLGKPHGEEYTSSCPTLHAEEWAIVNAVKAEHGEELKGAVIYISGINMPEGAKPCWHCKRLLEAVGIKKVVIG